MTQNSFQIQLPATSANLGLGFDSMGLALAKFLTVSARPSQQWHFSFGQQDLEHLPHDQTNLVAQAAIYTAQKKGVEMPPLAVEMTSQIPLTHGLGSSSSAIVAGVILADHFCQLELSREDKVKIATALEGHPDNVGPCITGGVFIGGMHQDQVYYENLDLGDLGLVLSVPPYEVPTQEARRVLPDTYEKGLAIQQNALNNVMVLALLKQDYQKVGKLMMADAFHQPYRQSLIPEFGPIRDHALNRGAYSTVISGAGPTILTLCPPAMAEDLVKSLQVVFPSCHHEVTAAYPLQTP
ncbi:TPA: homoserine kinase [Streptococcus suis]